MWHCHQCWFLDAYGSSRCCALAPQGALYFTPPWDSSIHSIPPNPLTAFSLLLKYLKYWYQRRIACVIVHCQVFLGHFQISFFMTMVIKFGGVWNLQAWAFEVWRCRGNQSKFPSRTGESRRVEIVQIGQMRLSVNPNNIGLSFHANFLQNFPPASYLS